MPLLIILVFLSVPVGFTFWDMITNPPNTDTRLTTEDNKLSQRYKRPVLIEEKK